MKLSEVLKRYVDWLSEFHPEESYQIIECIDDYELALILSTSENGYLHYRICTLRKSEYGCYSHETIACYLEDDKKIALASYNILKEYAKIHNSID